MIDMASVYADRFKNNADALRAAVMGQSPDPKLDPYTALNALKLVNESQRMAMAGQAQQPTSSPSILAENIAPPAAPQGLAGMVPMGAPAGQMPQGMPPQGMPQGMPPQGMPQQTMQAASGGLANMYTPEEDFAEGGIVAFQSGGPAYTASSAGPVAYAGSSPAVDANPLASNTEGVDDGERDDYLAMLDELEGGGGSPAGLAAANALTLATARRIASRDLRDLTPEEYKTRYATELEKITTAAGPSPYAGMRADLVEQGKERAGNLEFAKGEALLQAASDVLEGNNAMRGLAKGGAKFAKVYGEAQRADKLAKRSMSQMEFHIADAERKERMGNSRAATAAVERASKDRKDMNKAELDRDIALGKLATEMGKVNKPPRAAGSGGEGKLPQVDRDAAAMAKQIIDLESTNPDDPKLPALKKKLTALEKIIATTKTTESGPGKLGAQESQIFIGAVKDSSANARKRLYADPVMRSNDPVAMNKRYREIYAEEIQGRFPKAALSDLLAQMPAEELPAGGKAPAPAASAKALPMPASKEELKTNQLYNTSQGPAVWNGTKFVAQ
jgi:hypothetical protein